MSAHRIVRRDDATPQPWRNGGGVTRELLAWPAADDWRLRISVADVAADGPFSAFPGVARWFAVLDGAGVELRIDGRATVLRRGDAPFAFAGDAATDCRLLDGPTRDLNLMLRGGAAGGMALAADGAVWRPAGERCGLFSAVAGRCEIGNADDRRGAEAGTAADADAAAIALPAHALLWFDAAPPALRFVADAPAAGLAGWWLWCTPPEDRR